MDDLATANIADLDAIYLAPIKQVSGEVTIPGSKSLSNRALLLAALADGKSRLTNLLDSDDIRHMLTALAQLGVSYTLNDNKSVCEITGLGGRFRSETKQKIFLGNAGTAMRPLCAALAFSDANVILHGEPRMHERPIGDLTESLIHAGANIEYIENTGYPPIHIKPSEIHADTFEVDGSVSSQFLTALLMATPLLNKSIDINITGQLVSKPYIDITTDTMAKFGVCVVNNQYKQFCIDKSAKFIANDKFVVEGDASSASYFLAAAAIKGGSVTVHGVGTASVQGDKDFALVLEKMGATVIWNDYSITVKKGQLTGVDLDLNHIPDAAMTIATTALFATGPTTIRNIYNWRVKETDRLHAMATELRKVGAKVEEGNDYIHIIPPERIRHAEIDTYDDHRMAMCFSLVALDENSGVTINDPGCTSKTFPDYFAALDKISKR